LDPNVYWCLQELLRRTAYLSEQLAQVTSRLQTMQAEVAALQNRSSTHIDKIEYSFEQLKVETLAGTLVIGMAGGLEGSVEEFTLGQTVKQDVKLGAEGPQGLQTMSSEPFVRIHRQLQDYFHQELDGDVERAAKEHGQEADEELRQAIKKDLSRQADRRIAVYLKELQTKEEVDAELEQDIARKVKDDIRSGLGLFFEHSGKDASTP